MPGHGIKEHNLREVIQATGAKEFHLYLTKMVKSKMKFFREHVKMGNKDLSEYDHLVADAEKIRISKEIIHKYDQKREK